MFSKLGFFGKDIESKGENATHECGPRILRFFDALPNFSFITWETALLVIKKWYIKLPLKLLQNLGF